MHREYNWRGRVHVILFFCSRRFGDVVLFASETSLQLSDCLSYERKENIFNESRRDIIFNNLLKLNLRILAVLFDKNND